VILVLIGAVLVLGIMKLHPQSDPVDVMGNVAKGLAPTIAGILALMKSQETHLSVNSRMDTWMAQNTASAHQAGVADERARVTETPALPEEKANPS
jgi:hypothetical protein